MTNSISTIFTMDIYSKMKPGKSQRHYVHVGRIATLVSLTIALVVAEPLLGKFDQAFQYIQEFTGFFTPGIVVIFCMGMFWSKASSAGALAAAIGSAVFSILLKVYWVELPFMDRVGLVFLLCLALCVIVSLIKPDQGQDSSVSLDDVSFDTSRNFNVAAIGIILILTALYATWW